MPSLLSACGLWCNQCHFYPNECHGCYVVQGSTFWAKEIIANQICPLYQCSIMNKKYKNCGQCAELPCKLFNEIKDPNISEAEHKKSIQARVCRLQGI